MSEANDKFEELKERAGESLLQMLREEFEELASTCEDRIGPDEDAICFYHGSNPVDCCFSVCPRSNLPFNMASSHLEERKRMKK